MSILIILICILLTVIIFITNNDNLFNPIKLFFCLWTLIIILSIINITKLTKPSAESYLLIMIMIFSFFIGNTIACKLKKKNVPKKNEKKNSYELLERVFYMLCFMAITFNIIDIVLLIRFRLNGIPMWQIRNWTLEPFGSVNPILSRRSFVENVLRNIIIDPFMLLVHPITAYHLFFAKEKKTKLLMVFVSIIILVTSSLAGAGGRLVYIYFVLSYLLAFFAMVKTKNVDSELLKKYKKIIISFIIASFFAVVGFTILRVGRGSFINQFCKYFAMPPTLLSKWLPMIKKEPHTYGLLTTFGIHSYFFRTLNQLGLGTFVPQIFNDSFKNILNAEIVLPIGDGVGNAFVTPIYYFYIDGGYPFVVGASLFFGFLITKIFHRIDDNVNLRNFIIYMIIMYGVLVSFMRIQTAMPSYFISIVFALLITKQNPKKKLKKNIFKKNKIVNNSIMLFIFNIAKIVFPFVTLPYLTRVLTKDTYGTVTYVKTVMTYLQILVDFGFVLSGTKDIINCNGNQDKINTVIGDTLLARTILGLAGFIITFILSLCLPILRENILYTMLSYFVVFLSIFLFDFVFRGYEKMHVITIRFIAMKLISTTFTFILIKNDGDILLIPLLDVISSSIAILLVLFETKKIGIKIKISKVKNSLTKIKTSFIYFLSNVASTSFNALSTIIIGIYLSKTDVAYWGLCMQIIGTIQACYSPITDAIYPEMIRSKNIKLINKILIIFGPLISLGCIIGYFLTPFGINLLGGSQYLEAVPIFRLLIPCLFFGFFGILYGWPVLGAINKQKEVTCTTVYSFIFNILLLIILIITNSFTLVNIAIVRVLTEVMLFVLRFRYYKKYRNYFS